MKRLITLTLVIFSVLGASAQFGQSVLNIRLNNNAPMRVVIDGREAGPMTSAAHITNLNSGQHFLQVYTANRNWGHGNGHHHDRVIAYNGYIVLTGNAESWVTVFPEMQKVKFDNVVAFAPPVVNPGKIRLQEQCNEFVNHAPVAPVRPIGPLPMNPQAFESLKQTINNAGFENTRLSIFKQALAYNNFTTRQVRELMGLFWYESSKLEVAKLAYPKTLDQNNYYLVNNEFSFSGSVDELGNYIAMR